MRVRLVAVSLCAMFLTGYELGVEGTVISRSGASWSATNRLTSASQRP